MKIEELVEYLKEKGFEHTFTNVFKLKLIKTHLAFTLNPFEIVFECGTKKNCWFCIVCNSEIQKLDTEQIHDLFEKCIKEYFAYLKLEGVQQEIDHLKNRMK